MRTHTDGSIPMKCTLNLLTLSCALTAMLASGAHAQSSFKPGDIYLSTPAYFGISSSDGAIVRIDPLTGTTSLFLAMPGTANGQDSMAYDPYRDRLVVRGGFAFGDDVETYLIDAHGNRTSLGFPALPGPFVGSFAPSSIGNIYFRGFFSQTEIRYYDANNNVQTLMDATGTTPWSVPGFAGAIYHMIYHPATNSLIIAYSAGANPICPGGSTLAANIRRVDLSPDGSRVVNVECFQFDLDPGDSSGVPVGLSPGPGDDLIMTLDNNNSNALPRMVRVNPAALLATPFAINSNAFSGATNGGCYSHSLGKAIILDSFDDVLRAFSAGESSSGLMLAPGISPPGSSGEIVSMVEIGALGANYTMTSNSDTIPVSTGGTQSWTIDFGPGHAGDVYLVFGSMSGWNPGTDVGSVHIPLVQDGYSSIVINRANTSNFPNSFGVLDGFGRASSAIVSTPLPPSMIGARFYHATVAYSSSQQLIATTNAVTLTFE